MWNGVGSVALESENKSAEWTILREVLWWLEDIEVSSAKTEMCDC